MNYYEKHIGDYIRDTVSLTMLEDGAYNRLMDQYYQTERPLPLDRKMIYRLARATSAAERKACDFVVETFFLEMPDGYTQKRIASEIDRYRDKQRKAKASAEARWSKTDRNANASLTHGADDMRTHSEGNAHQSPDTSKQSKPPPSSQVVGKPAPVDNSPQADDEKIEEAGQPPGIAMPADGDAPTQVVGWIRFFRDECGVEIDAHAPQSRAKFWPLATAWIAAGVTREQMRAAVRKAREDSTEPIAYLPSYADRVLASMQAGEARKAIEWWGSEDATRSKGAEYRLTPRAGEDWGSFRERIRTAIAQQADEGKAA